MAGKGVVLVVVLVVIVIGFMVFRGGGDSDSSGTTNEVPAVLGDESVDEAIVGSDGTDDEGASDDAGDAGASETPPERVVKEFDVIARQWEFSPNPIEVDMGDTVILNIESTDVTHGIVISDFGVSERLISGNMVRIEFVADKTGSFSFFCNVQCGSGHGSMRGTLIVN